MSASQDIWSFHGVKAFPGPSNSVVLHRWDGNQRLMVQPDVAQALTHCNHYRSIDSHIKAIASALPAMADHTDQVRKTLLAIADAGLMESGEEAWVRLTQSADKSIPNADQARLFILTCDRPHGVQRVLDHIAELPLDERVESIWVIDDSRNAENVNANAQLISEANKLIGVPLRHADQRLKDRLIAHVLTELPPATSALNFLLSRDSWGSMATYGLARNFALLLSVGVRALVMDDDIIPEAIAPPLSGAALTVSKANDREAVFYESQASLNQHALKLSESPVTLMLDALGRSIGSLMTSQLTSSADLVGWDGKLTSHLGAHSAALLAQCGSWGDWGTAGGGSSLMFLGSKSIKRLLEQNIPFQELLAANASWFGYRGPTISRYGTMSQMTGIDHSRLVPPYMPAGRGEDMLFGVMLERIHPEAFVYNSGWAINHNPVDGRSGKTSLAPSRFNAGTGLLADWLGFEPRDQWGLNPERRMAGLAHQVDRLASMPPDNLEALIDEMLVSKRTSVLSQCMRQLSELEFLTGSPRADEWRSFLEASRDSLVADILSSQERPLQDAADKLAAAGIDNLQAQGAAFSEALAMWPQICEAASSFSP